MAKVKVKSPRSIPRSQQDVDRAYQKGLDAGTELCLTLVLYTLKDKFNADDAQLTEFSDAFHYTLDSIQRGYITEADLRTVMKVEYDTTIEVKK